MTSSPLLKQIEERVERLLVRQEELHRANLLLTARVRSLTQERDQLQSKFDHVRQRVDALLTRLPAGEPQETDE